MKTTKIVTLAILGISFYGFSSCNNADKKSANNMDSMSMNSDKAMDMNNGMMKGMQGMMDNIKMTGSFDCDFATLMINHHQSAILMGKEELKNGKNEEMRALAQNIITNQTEEVEKMHSLLNNFKTVINKDTTNSDSKLQTTMTQMMDAMHQIKLTGNTDKDFAMMMIPHHKSAVKMAEDELKYGKQNELIKIAKQIINDQNREINLFDEWLAKQK